MISNESTSGTRTSRDNMVRIFLCQGCPLFKGERKTGLLMPWRRLPYLISHFNFLHMEWSFFSKRFWSLTQNAPYSIVVSTKRPPEAVWKPSSAALPSSLVLLNSRCARRRSRFNSASHCGVLLCTPHSSGFRPAAAGWAFSNSLYKWGCRTACPPVFLELHSYCQAERFRYRTSKIWKILPCILKGLFFIPKDTRQRTTIPLIWKPSIWPEPLCSIHRSLFS